MLRQQCRGPARDYSRAASIEFAGGVGHRVTEEDRKQVLKAEAAIEDTGFLKGAACDVALKRLDESGFVDRFEKRSDCLHPGMRGGVVVVEMLEAEHRTVNVGQLAVIVELGCAHRLAGPNDGDDRVGGAEVEADRKRVVHRCLAAREKDQFNLLYGARRFVRRLNELGIAHRYEEFPDNHTSVDYRMDESLPFLAHALTG